MGLQPAIGTFNVRGHPGDTDMYGGVCAGGRLYRVSAFWIRRHDGSRQLRLKLTERTA